MSDGDYGDHGFGSDLQSPSGDMSHGDRQGQDRDHQHGGSENATASATDLRNRTGILSEDRKIEIHVQSHGACDVKQLFFREAERLGMVAIHVQRPNLVPEDRREKKILDWDAFSPPDDERTMPFGHYKGATGWTRLWKEYWHLGKRREPWKFWTPLEPDFSQRTWIDILCVTWCYNELGDLETKFSLEVRSLYAWDVALGKWVHDEFHCERHKQVAKKLAKAMLDSIAAHKPLVYATRVREQWRSERLAASVAASRSVEPVSAATAAAPAAQTPPPAAKPTTTTGTPVPKPCAGSAPCDLGGQPASGADISRLLGC